MTALAFEPDDVLRGWKVRRDGSAALRGRNDAEVLGLGHFLDGGARIANRARSPGHGREDEAPAGSSNGVELLLEMIGAAGALGKRREIRGVGGLAAGEDDDGLVGFDERAGEVGIEVARFEI